MKNLSAILVAFLLVACGGGGDPDPVVALAAAAAPTASAAPLAQCTGTPKAAIVYAGAHAFPELAAVSNACVYSTAAATVQDLKGVIDTATAAAGTERVYLIATDAGAGLALGYMNTNPGHTDTPSIWFAPFTTFAAGGAKSIISVHLNDTDAAACAKQAAVLPMYVPPQCVTWPDANFGPEQRAAAIAQLHLELLR